MPAMRQYALAFAAAVLDMAGRNERTLGKGREEEGDKGEPPGPPGGVKSYTK